PCDGCVLEPRLAGPANAVEVIAAASANTIKVIVTGAVRVFTILTPCSQRSRASQARLFRGACAGRIARAHTYIRLLVTFLPRRSSHSIGSGYVVGSSRVVATPPRNGRRTSQRE